MDRWHDYLRVLPSIEGWFYGRDAFTFIALHQIQRASGISGDLAEVGVYHGKSLGLIATFRAKDEHVYGFDLFQPPASLERTSDTIIKATGSTEGVSLLAMNSQLVQSDELERLVPRPLRFLHIDAGHEYEEALSDLRKFSARMSDTGVLAIDDFYIREFPGVCAAAHEFIRESDFVPFFGSNVKLYLCRRIHSKGYIRALLSVKEISQDAKFVTFRNSPMIVGFAQSPDPLEKMVAWLNQGARDPRR